MQTRGNSCPLKIVTSRYCAPETPLDVLMPFLERRRPDRRRDIHNISAGITPNTAGQNAAANARVKPPGPPLVVTTMPRINSAKTTQMIARQIWFPFQEALRRDERLTGGMNKSGAASY